MQSKALLLQSWYALSDPGLEKQLARDLMFRRFINLGLSEGVPDHSNHYNCSCVALKRLQLVPYLLEGVQEA
jgi:IS5 family transposase